MSNSDQIKTEISETAASLEKKVRELESRLRDNATEIKEKVTETLDGIKGLSDLLSPRKNIERHPLAAFGICMAAGLLAAATLRKRTVPTKKTVNVSGSLDPLKPILTGIATGIVCEVAKEHFPSTAPYATAIQTAAVAKTLDSIGQLIHPS
jgi:hypothetical protein